MARRLESSIERAVVEYAKKLGVLVHKTGQDGWPDRLFLFKGRVAWIEFKREGEEPRPLQKYVHKEMAQRGHTVYVVDDVTYGKALIDNFIRGLT